MLEEQKSGHNAPLLKKHETLQQPIFAKQNTEPPSRPSFYDKKASATKKDAQKT